MSFFYTEEQLAFVRKRKTMPRDKLTAAFNKNFSTTKTKDQIKGLCRRKGWTTGNDGRFKKGHLPHNAGTKGKGICKPNSGSFQKGNKPVNWKSVGSERICSKDGYILIKTAEPRTWRHKHTVIWEAAHGPVSKGDVVIFKDGDVLNCSLDNLIKISRRELLWLNRNGFKKTPPEFKPTLLMLAKINVKAFRLGNK